jgi:hypothetical protein
MQQVIEDAVKRNPTKKSKDDADGPALVRARLEVKKDRERNGNGKTEEPYDGEKPKNPSPC